MLRECVKYLESVAQNYKAGIKLIPKEELKNIDIPFFDHFYGEKKALYFFVTVTPDPDHFLETKEGELLIAAVEKGMRLALEEVGVYCATRPVKYDCADKIVLILGDKAGWELGDYKDCTPTEALSNSLYDHSAKKKFWRDLQHAMSIASGG